ncbi:MAG TPA: hypothetical protein PLC48_15145, partial [Ferruginibacter sp.]|nr:hypothetical protein [Ferruginibacter sp.]
MTEPLADLGFQWMFKGLPVEGATDSVLVIQNTSPSDTGFYYCHITQGEFSWKSDSVNVAVRENPAFNKFSDNDQDLMLPDGRLLADMDNNGDYDAICKQKIIYNDSLSFIQNDPISLIYADVSVIDILNDQDLFIFTHDPLCSNNPECTRPSKLQRIKNGHQEIYESEILDRVVTWADFDNDGKPEGIAMKFGQQGLDIFYWVYLVEFENDTVYETVAGQVFFGNYYTLEPEVDAADYDADGDIDLLITDIPVPGTPYRSTSILLNTGGVFQELPIPARQNHSQGKIQWFDADSDNDLDFLFNYLIYTNYSPWIAMVLSTYTHNEGGFELESSDTIPVSEQYNNPKPIVLDYDNNGSTDIVFKTSILKNNNDNYELTPSTYNPAHTGLTEDAMSFGDFDNDGDLDILGKNAIFTNDVCNVNNLPSAPPGFLSNVTNHGALFSWQKSTDLETPQMGLTYNLRVGTTPGGNEIMSSM